MKILYGVAGEGGMGHAVRSLSIIQHLKKDHEVKVVVGGRGSDFFKKYFDVEEVIALQVHYKKNRVRMVKTSYEFLKHYAFERSANISKVKKIAEDFKPDVIITDCEPLTAIVARKKKIPLMAIDNISLLTRCKLKPGFKNFKHHFISKTVIERINARSNYYLIPAFFYPDVKFKNVFLVPPVLRDEVLNLQTVDQGYFLVYQTSDSNDLLLSMLKQTNSSFIVYGFNQDKVDGNLTFRKFNDDVFFKDLSGCKGVIANGGFTLISEALYLGKPVLSIPIENLYEQILNAHHIEKLGYGIYSKKANVEALNSFISQISKFKKNLADYPKEDNTKLFNLLDALLVKFQK